MLKYEIPLFPFNAFSLTIPGPPNNNILNNHSPKH